jgi:S-DNA-T family DNA segregation ATPase FtsK/SpoIIIE
MKENKEVHNTGRIKREIIAVALIGISILVFLSLVSYDPMDLAWDSRPSHAASKAKNMIGPIGSTVSELLMNVFGYASYSIPVFFLFLGLRFVFSLHFKAGALRYVGIVLFIIASSAFIHIAAGQRAYVQDSPGPSPVPKSLTILSGGLVGKAIAELLTEKFNVLGTFVLVLMIQALAAILALQFSVGRLFASILGMIRTIFGYLKAWTIQRLERRKIERIQKKEAARRQIAAAKAQSKIEEKVKKEEEKVAEPPKVLKGKESIPEEVEAFFEEEPEPEAESEYERAVEKKKERTRKRKTQTGAAGGHIQMKFDIPQGEYVLPPSSLLDPPVSNVQVDNKELVDNAKVLVSKLKEFQVDGSVQQIIQGPIVTTYEFKPNAGVKYSKITGLGEDLCLAMEAESIRIDRIPGKSTVGVEVPNREREIIYLREVIESETFQGSQSRLTLALGKEVDGTIFTTDLSTMPHLLIAGTTGTGKSVCVNSMITSILYKARPDEVKLILVDPKRIELGVYNNIPHLLTPVVTDPKVASKVLQWTTTEMENRYKKLAVLGVRNIDQFNVYIQDSAEREHFDDEEMENLKPLPYIVVVIDELADLMMVAAKDVEESISRLAAMARAVGIHLILATQRPSVDVLTGVIKANLPSRISFRVASKVDSRTIIDCNGAESLLGMGDMLFLPPGTARLVRIHGPFVSNAEVQRVTNFLKRQGKPDFNPVIMESDKDKKCDMEGELDEIYGEALRIILETGQASISYLQRRLKLGYSRAARLIDMMEYNGVVGPKDGSKNREILVGMDYMENMKAGHR